MSNKKPSAYADAGVDIDAAMGALRRAKKKIQKTFTPGVVGDIGSFGGLFKSPGPGSLLVTSTDGVGTKLKVANMAGVHNTVGQDLVNHCVNDILVQGAEPLFFLDYVGAANLEPNVLAEILDGFCKACRKNGCALLGGETAEMPGLYPRGEYDLVGTIVGSVKKSKLITGEKIRSEDVLIGLPSSGLHTNGYSLARKVIFEKAKLKPTSKLRGTKKTVADVLLAVHKSYLKPIRALMKCMKIRGMVHVTGGGFVDNIARILPEKVSAVVDRSTWKVPPVFTFIQKKGQIDRDEMYRVFNMGIGMIVIVREDHAVEALDVLRDAGEKPVIIGRIEKGEGEVRLVG